MAYDIFQGLNRGDILFCLRNGEFYELTESNATLEKRKFPLGAILETNDPSKVSKVIHGFDRYQRGKPPTDDVTATSVENSIKERLRVLERKVGFILESL